MSYSWIRLMSCVCPDNWPTVLHGKSFNVGYYIQTFQPIFFIHISNMDLCNESFSQPAILCGKNVSIRHSDLSTHLYLTVLVWKSVSSTDVHPYFSKYGQRVSRKYGNHDVNKRDFVANELDLWALVELSLLDICLFQAISGGWNVRPVLIGQKSFQTNEHRLCIGSFTEVSHLQIWRVWVHSQWHVAAVNRTRGRMQETKETSSDQKPFKKGRVSICRSLTLGALLLEKVFCSLWQEGLEQM